MPATNDYLDEFGSAGVRFVNELVVHCSASKNGESLFVGMIGQSNFRMPVEIIDEWHQKHGFHRDEKFRQRFNPRLRAIGYHFVIYTNGAIVTGRHMDEIGAHVVGNNRNSIGICMVGTDCFTPRQWESLAKLIEELKNKYRRLDMRVLGHRDLSPDKNNDGIVEPWEWLKTCPGFDVITWVKAGMKPEPKHVLEEA